MSTLAESPEYIAQKIAENAQSRQRMDSAAAAKAAEELHQQQDDELIEIMNAAHRKRAERSVYGTEISNPDVFVNVLSSRPVSVSVSTDEPKRSRGICHFVDGFIIGAATSGATIALLMLAGIM